jgi:carbon storage regulator CsrA
MLIRTWRVGEAVLIGEQIRVVVAAVRGDRIRLGNCAAATVRVDRQEVHERRYRFPCLRIPNSQKSHPLKESDQRR